MNLNRRIMLKTFVVGGASATLAGFLAACGSGTSTSAKTSTGTASDTPSSTTGADASAFPVTIKSALGDAVIPKAPERMVTLSWINHDAAIALGVIPVGIPKFVYGGDANGYLPWDAAALEGKTKPTLIDDTGKELPFEAIAALKPDVILAAFSGLTKEQFTTLSKIAPVVAYPEKAYATSWEETTTLVGKALGKSAEATKLIAATNQIVETEVAKHPDIKGKTFVYAAANTEGSLNVYKETDVRVQFVTQLGMTLAPTVMAAAPKDDSFFFAQSDEKVSDLKSDILIAYFASQADLDKFKANKLYAALPQVASGAFAPIVGEAYVMASSAPSSLAIPYMLPEYLKQISAAVAKVAK